MKKQQQKNLYASLPVGMAFMVLITIGCLLFSKSANAQIVYTDVNPDTTISCSAIGCTQSYNLDLNNDGIVDFTLYTAVNSGPCPGFGGFAVYKRVYITSQSGNGTVTLMMNANDTIESNLAFSPSIGTLRSVFSGANCSGSAGNWTSTSDHYLGLQITIGASTYYGWARLNVVVTATSSPAFTVKDYAYNSIPNQPILAGQTVATGISPLSFGEGLGVRLFPNPASNRLTIALGSNNKKVEVTIADITGKIIYSTTALQTQNVEVNTQDFAKGIYVVKIQSAEFIATKKLVIEK